MANKRGSLICPRCRDHGFVVERAVKNRVQLPKRTNVVTLYEALDYAAKTFLRLHEDVIRFPPSPELEKVLYQSQLEHAYSEFTKFSLHTTEEIRAFESRQLSLLKRKVKKEPKNRRSHHTSKLLDGSQNADKYVSDMERPKESPVHVRLPDNTGNVTRMSILWLYAAIVFTVLRDMICVYQMSEEDDKWFASVVYSYYSFLVSVNDKKLVNPLRWFKILEDVKNHGYNAASSRNYVVGTYCKRCKI